MQLFFLLSLSTSFAFGFLTISIRKFSSVHTRLRRLAHLTPSPKNVNVCCTHMHTLLLHTCTFIAIHRIEAAREHLDFHTYSPTRCSNFWNYSHQNACTVNRKSKLEYSINHGTLTSNIYLPHFLMCACVVPRVAWMHLCYFVYVHVCNEYKYFNISQTLGER